MAKSCTVCQHAQYLHLLVEHVEVEVSGEVRHTWQERLSTAHRTLEARRQGCATRENGTLP